MLNRPCRRGNLSTRSRGPVDPGMDPRRNGPESPMHSFLGTAAATALCALASCAGAAFSGQLGYMQSHMAGEIALAPNVGGSNLGTIREGIDDLGLGDESGSPYARAQADLGIVSLSASGFLLHDEGTAPLNVNFGGITAGTTVNSKVDFANIKTALVFPIDLGAVH